MKLIKSILLSLAAVVALGNLSSCQSPDKEFEHDNNIIGNMVMTLKPGGAGISGVIREYNAKGELVPANEVTVQSVSGGHGEVLFILSLDLKGEYNPEHCYLGASLTFDQIIKPGLAGIKDITNRDPQTGVARGIEIDCCPGVGTPRPYKVIGYFEGEETLTPEK